jgi:hypothetical protein
LEKEALATDSELVPRTWEVGLRGEAERLRVVANAASSPPPDAMMN